VAFQLGQSTYTLRLPEMSNYYGAKVSHSTRNVQHFIDLTLTCSHCTSLVQHSITTRSSIRRFITKSRDGSPPLGSSGKCSNAANIGQRKTWTQSVFCTWQWQNSVRGQESQKCIYSVSARRRPNIIQSVVDLC